MADTPFVAYLTMEAALESDMPTYSGGLGVLAGDTLRSAADLGIRMAGVTLLHRKGYFAQTLDPRGRQSETPDAWRPEQRLERLRARVAVEIEGRTVRVAAWRYRIWGVRGHEVPVYLLDTDLSENAQADRVLTDHLYGGDDSYRLRQEAVLGLGGVAMLRALGHTALDRFHLNEGHAALAVLALLEERAPRAPGRPARPRARDLEAVRRSCVFTTHTPVAAGHDVFPADLARRVLGARRAARLAAVTESEDLHLTELALAGAGFVNGVAMRHGEVSRRMFPGRPIRAITNGVHAPTFAAAPFQALFDRHVPGWREDPAALRQAAGIPLREVGAAHAQAKRALLEVLRAGRRSGFRAGALTLGFARRATAYKRASLIFRDPERLAAMASRLGPIQLVFAGKAHPRDQEGQRLIQAVFEAARRLRGRVAVAYLPGYDLDLGRLLTSGCDVWLNTPVPPQEASGTSGMKAALNGVPSISVLDGWWVEGCVEGVTGWAIGADPGSRARGGRRRDARDADALYAKLEESVAPCFYSDRTGFRRVMRSAIALNASYFNTHRMLLEYLHTAYAGGPADRKRPAGRTPGRAATHGAPPPR